VIKLDFFDTDGIYNEQFEKTYRFMKSGLTQNTEEDILILKSTLKNLSDFQGLDWIGRGELFLIKNQASIAATETLLYELTEIVTELNIK